MGNLSDFFKKVRKMLSSGGRVFRHSDPSDGISYNEINGNRYVTTKIFSVDIARTPVVIKDIGNHVDVQGKARKANSHRCMVDYRANKFRGRTGVY